MSNRRFNTQTRKAAMGGGMMKRGMYKKGSFPDMSGDGKITKKDILIARGVIKKPKGKKDGKVMSKRKSSGKKKV
jgi:hypothetical protein